MGGTAGTADTESGGNKNMINVPVKIEIKDNNLLSGSSKKKEYSSSSPAEKVIECRKSNRIKFEVKNICSLQYCDDLSSC